MIKREDKIFCEKHGNFRDSVLLDVMKIYCSKSGNLMITSKKNFNKIVCSNNLDLNSYKFINILREKKDNSLKKLSPVVGEKIYPLYFFLDKEILIYAELKKLKYKKEIVKRSSLLSEKDSWINFLNDLEKKHPEIKNAIMNSYLKIIY
jgi:tRNA(Ile)-lysidine synthase TilS/MesJ